MEYVSYILDKIMKPEEYPLTLRILCKKLRELALSRNSDDERLANSLVGGFIFLRIFNPKITFYGKMRSNEYRKYSNLVRRKFTLISKIVQNISNQVQGGMKERWMASMNTFTKSKSQQITQFFRDVTDVEPLNTYFTIDQQIRSHSYSQSIMIYLSVEDLKMLAKLINEDYKTRKIEIESYADNEQYIKFYSVFEQIIAKSPFLKFPDPKNYYTHICLPSFINHIQNISSSTQESGISQSLKFSVLPVLRDLSNCQNILKQVKQTSDIISDTISYLRICQTQTKNIKGVGNAIAILSNNPNKVLLTNILLKLCQQTSTNSGILSHLKIEVMNMNNHFEQLVKDISDMRQKLMKLELVHAQKKASAKVQAQRGRLSRLQNLFAGDSSKRKANKDENINSGSSINIYVEQNTLALTQDIVAVDGMIGNMLCTLVHDVGHNMTTVMKRMPTKVNNIEFLNCWLGFPENVATYFPIIQRVARLGKVCMHELIKTIIDSDTKSNKIYEHKTEDKSFKLTLLEDHIKSIASGDKQRESIGSNDHQREQSNTPSSVKLLKTTSHPSLITNKKLGSPDLNGQLCAYVIDFMLVDILQHCLQWITAEDLKPKDPILNGKYNLLYQEVIDKCINKLTTIDNNKLGNELGRRWKLKRLRKWGVIISLLSPTHSSLMVHNLKIAYKYFSENTDGFLYGAAYIKFNCNKDNVQTIQEYFDWIIGLMQDNKNNTERMKLILHTLEHNVRSLIINEEINKPVYRLKVYNMLSILQPILKQKRNEMLHSSYRRLKSSILLRNPIMDYNRYTEGVIWLSKLINFRLNRKPIQAADILHFLRGGGSNYDQSIHIYNVSSDVIPAIAANYNKAFFNAFHKSNNTSINDNSTDKSILKRNMYFRQNIYEQAYGRITPKLRLSAQNCKILCDKLFRSYRTYHRTKDAVIIFILCSCAIQVCIHNFSYAIKSIIGSFLNDDKKTIERVFIAVYTLNFICVPECRFLQYLRLNMISSPSEWKQTEQSIRQYKRTIRPQLESIFVYLGKLMPINRYLLHVNDSVQAFNSQTISDDHIIFDEHVYKMLLFDWTDTPMEEYMTPIQNMETEFLIYCLRLAPYIECDRLWEANKQNCSMDGLFIGKWLLHKDPRVREQVLRTVLVAMKDEDKRNYVMKCFIQMLQIHDWQTPACLIMLLKTVKYLLDTYRTEVIVSEEHRKRHTQIRMAPSCDLSDTGDSDSHLSPRISKLYRGKELPRWFEWQNKADAIGLVLLCHYHTQVRINALQFLMKIKNIYKEFTGHGGGSIYIKNENQNHYEFIQSLIGARTVGHLIDIHGRSIARMSLMQFEQERKAEENDAINVVGGNGNRNVRAYAIESVPASSSANSRNTGFSKIIYQWGLIPFCMSQLAKRVVNAHMHETILCCVDNILYTLSFMPPCNTNNKNGWSAQNEWQGQNREYWVAIHTLFFSLVGSGLANPFSILTHDGFSAFQNRKKTLGGEIFRETQSKFRAYLSDYFWQCLYEEQLWVTEAINGILQTTHWESIPIVLSSIYEEFKKACKHKKKSKAVIADIIFILCNFGKVQRFATGLYIGGINTVEICFDLIAVAKSLAFRKDRMERRWWEAQTELAEWYGHILKALSNIGAHPYLRTGFWKFYNARKSLLDEVRLEWKLKKSHSLAANHRSLNRDNMPHIRGSNTEERFEMFKWLLKFIVDVDNIITPYMDPIEAKAEKQKIAGVRRAVFQGLQYLLNMGPVIPNFKLKTMDSYIINLLRGSKGMDSEFAHYSSAKRSILHVFIEAETIKYEVLTPLLTFQFESLIGFFIDQVTSTATSHKHASALFFRAIVNVIQEKGIRKLTAIESAYSNSSNWRIARPRGAAFLNLVFHYSHRLLFLGFAMITEPSPDTRYSGYLLLRSMAGILVGVKLVSKIDELKFAFESNMSLWVRKNGLKISEYFANMYPVIASLLFRVCIQYAENSERAEWIFTFLKPWARKIQLMPNEQHVIPEYIKQMNEENARMKQMMSVMSNQPTGPLPNTSSPSVQMRSDSRISPEPFKPVSRSSSANFRSKQRASYSTKRPSSSTFKKYGTKRMSQRDSTLSQKRHSNSRSFNKRESPIIRFIDPRNAQSFKPTNIMVNNISNSNNNSPYSDHSIPGPPPPIEDTFHSQNRTHQKQPLQRILQNDESKQAQTPILSPAEYTKEYAMQIHETFTLLSRLFDSTCKADDDLQTSYLRVWTDLATAHQYFNLFAILDFVVRKVEETKSMPNFKTAIIPTVKNIFFAIYEPQINRHLIIVYIVRIILRVLTIGSDDFSHKSLQIKQRAAKILSTLEERLERGTDDSTFSGWHYDIHREVHIFDFEDDVPDNNNINNASSKSGGVIDRKGSAPSGHRNHPSTGINGVNFKRSTLNKNVGSLTNSHRRSIVIEKEEQRASIAASLLVELIGVDCAPIKPFFPVLVLYATLYINQPVNKQAMLHLLVRLISTLSTDEAIEEIEKNTHSVVDDKPSLAAALTSRTLELLWDENINIQRKQFINNSGDFVVMDGASFVEEYAMAFEKRLSPTLRIGYEALRWAVLSTNVDLSTRSFHIYRQLLTPLDHSTVKVILLALAGAIDCWIDVGRYRNNKHNVVLYSREYRETNRILETLLKMASKLKEKKAIAEYEAFVWAGIALIRADASSETQKQVYKKGLQLLNLLLDDECESMQYLFLKSENRKRNDTSFPLTFQVGNRNRNATSIVSLPAMQNPGVWFSDSQKMSTVPMDLAYTRFDTNDSNTNVNNNRNTANPHILHQSGTSFSNGSVSNHIPPFTQHRGQQPSTDDYKSTGISNVIHEYNAEEPANIPLTLNGDDDEDHGWFENTYEPVTPGNISPNILMRSVHMAASITNAGYGSSDFLPESFLAYCIEWTPPFEGIQPYLLQGLLQAETEDQTFRVLMKVLNTKMDKLADRSSARPCICVVAIMPYVTYIMKYKPDFFATVSQPLFRSLMGIVSGFSMGLFTKFRRSLGSVLSSADCFLRSICELVVQSFFEEHAGLVANFLNVMLDDVKLSHHHVTVFKMAAYFLKADPDYIEAFEHIITTAHRTVSSEKNELKNQVEMADAATELVAVSIDELKFRAKIKEQQRIQDSSSGSSGGHIARKSSRRVVLKDRTWRYVHIENVSPFPEASLNDVSAALWGVMKECPLIGKYDN